MGNKGFMKRILPFFSTFAVGIFIASLFGAVGPWRGMRGDRCHRRPDIQQHQFEFESIREENIRLKEQIRSMGLKPTTLKYSESVESPVLDIDGPPPPPPAPPRIGHGDRGTERGYGNGSGFSTR